MPFFFDQWVMFGQHIHQVLEYFWMKLIMKSPVLVISCSCQGATLLPSPYHSKCIPQGFVQGLCPLDFEESEMIIPGFENPNHRPNSTPNSQKVVPQSRRCLHLYIYIISSIS